MSIRDDFKSYVDGNNLLAPNPVTPGTIKGSDNGPMYTSEYFVMLKKNKQLTKADIEDYDQRIRECLDSNGLLCRAPGVTDQEGPDDHYAVVNGCMELRNKDVPRKMLWNLTRYFGCLNNNQPGRWTLKSFLARQPQLVCSMISAAFPSLKNPIHYGIRLLALPLYIISAIILATSCIGTPTGDTDARRLAWHLGNCVSKVSLLNWFAYKLWLRRLRADYPDGMSGVAAIYYQPRGKNPYSSWWVT